MRKKTYGLTEEGRQIISLLLAGFSLYFYLFLFCGWAGELSACWRCLILTSGRHDPGNRVGQCCVYGFVTAGFRKMKLLVQTAAPLTAPVKSHGMLHCLDVNHLLQPHGRGGWHWITFVSLSRPLPNDPGPGWGAVCDPSLRSFSQLLQGGQNTQESAKMSVVNPEFQQGIPLLLVLSWRTDLTKKNPVLIRI